MGADGSLVLVTHFSVVLPVGLAFVSQIMCRAWAPNQNHDHTESTRDQKHIEHDLGRQATIEFSRSKQSSRSVSGHCSCSLSIDSYSTKRQRFSRRVLAASAPQLAFAMTISSLRLCFLHLSKLGYLWIFDISLYDIYIISYNDISIYIIQDNSLLNHLKYLQT